LLWIICLHALRLLALGLRLFAKELYVRAVQFIQQELNDNPVPLIDNSSSRVTAAREERKDELEVPGEVSRLRSMDEKAGHHQLVMMEEKRLETSRTAEEGSRTDSSHPSPASPSLPPLPPSRAGTPNRSSSTQYSRLIAPRPFSLAAAMSLDSLNSSAMTPDDISALHRLATTSSSSPSHTPRISHSSSSSFSPLSSISSPFVSRSSSASSPGLSPSSRSLDNTSSYPPRRRRKVRDVEGERKSMPSGWEEGHNVHEVEREMGVKVESDGTAEAIAAGVEGMGPFALPKAGV
jgi:hypothetical protein